MLILIPESVYRDYLEDAQEIAPQAKFLSYGEETPPPSGIEDTEAVLRGFPGKQVDEIVGRAQRLRWLHTPSAGVDHILTPAVRAKEQLIVTDSGPAFEIAISEFVLAWMLSAAHRLPELKDHQRAHRWQSEVQQELWGKTAGIIGLGPIGRGIALRAKAFGMQTLGLRRTPAPVSGVDEVLTGETGLAQLLASSDYVILAAALTGETQTLIGVEQLVRMKPNAWLINIARGALIDQDALIHALNSKQIAGACLDVFAQEPLPDDSPLWDMSNVQISPHNSSGQTAGLAARQKSIFLENLQRFVSGEELRNRVDITRGY